MYILYCILVLLIMKCICICIMFIIVNKGFCFYINVLFIFEENVQMKDNK